MIIDFCAYLGNWPLYQLPAGDAPALISVMDRCGIGAAFVSLAEGPFLLNPGEANERLVNMVAAHRDRLWPVGTADLNAPFWREDVVAGIERQKLAGFRAYPTYHRYALDSAEAVALAATLAEYQRPLFIAAFIDEERFQHPAIRVPPVRVPELAGLIRRVPQTTLVLNNLSVEEAAMLFDAPELSLENVFIDVNAMDKPFNGLAQLVEDYGAERLVFGSQVPFLYPEAALALVQESGISQEGVEAILAQNYHTSATINSLLSRSGKEKSMFSATTKLTLDKSVEPGLRAGEFIPGITQTISKRPAAFAPGYFPDFIDYGKGSHVWDVDGNEYIDYVMACGPVTLGYCYPAVDQAIREQLARGIIFTRLTALEGEVAEILSDVVPCAEMTRFFKGGVEANSAALRLARAFTNREKVVSCGYRGWHDQWAVTHSPQGIPACLANLITEFEYNNLDSLEAALSANPKQVAAVFIDPVSGERPKEGFLAGVEELAHKHGALLIFDEIVTGFRLAVGGAQAYYNVVPDIAVFAKGIANGMPLSAVSGRRDVMKMATEVFMTLTYGDEALSLAAARATLNVQRQEDVSGHIWDVGTALVNGVKQALVETGAPFTFSGIEAMPAFVAAADFRGRPLDEATQQAAWVYLLSELARRGIIWRRHSLILPSYSHSHEDVSDTVEACHEVFTNLAQLLESGTLHDAIQLTELPSGFKRV
ncbi:MAG: aminotransferase class III-fold pyridoxal phosphate-dependent enzyme [Chloroflexota bacterium]|nr:aminotransferase class III-fold pyridoxal phosphate-dependent enzyme [Chloroflexota bacterium]